MRLSKEQSRARWARIRQLWVEWDPIGVMSMLDWPRDEYDSYLGPTLRLLERRASVPEIEAYLAEVTLYVMGLTESEAAQQSRVKFAARLREWYETEWPESDV